MSVTLHHQSVRFSIDECPDFRVEVTDVALGPLDLQSWTLQRAARHRRRHAVPSKGGRYVLGKPAQPRVGIHQLRRQAPMSSDHVWTIEKMLARLDPTRLLQSN